MELYFPFIFKLDIEDLCMDGLTLIARSPTPSFSISTKEPTVEHFSGP